MYSVANVSYPDILRTATTCGTNNGLLYQPPGIKRVEYRQDGGKPSTVTDRDGILIRRFEIHNRYAGTNDVGIGFRYGPSHWKVGRLDSGGTTYTDLTETAQAYSQVTLGVAGADQTGFVIVADQPIDWIAVNITTAETNAGGSTVVDHVAQYSATGNTWTAISTAKYIDNFTLTDTVLTAAIKLLAWQHAADHTGITNVTGIPVGWYGIRVTAAQREADDVAPIATGIECGSLLSCATLAQNGIYANETLEYKNYGADGVIAYFTNAAALNRVYCECKPVG